MNEQAIALAIVLIVAVGGLAVIFVDSGTGMAATPLTQSARQVRVEPGAFCNQLKNEISVKVAEYLDTGCGNWYSLPELICPKPVKSGYKFSFGPPKPDDPNYWAYSMCNGIVIGLSDKVRQLEIKAEGNDGCKTILGAVRAPYNCPRQLA